MKIHRFIGSFNLAQDNLSISDQEVSHQIRNVLKLHKGEQIILCDGQEHDALAIILEINKHAIEAAVLERMDNSAETNNDVVLYCAILKRENFELVIQKAVEVGVKAIIPIITARTIKTDVKLERLQKIAKEAAEQSGRGTVPRIGEPMKFDEAAERAADMGDNLFFNADGGKLDLDSNKPNINLWIGPEGGWTDEELGIAKNSGFKTVSLGKRVLRGETAAIVASYLQCRD